MDDGEIIKLLYGRDEAALEEIKRQYEYACKKAAFRILGNDEDAEEAFSDALLTVWNKIPPDHPEDLGGYIYKTVRYEALEKYRKNNRQKRSGAVTVSLCELEDCVPGGDTETEFDERVLSSLIDSFLSDQKREDRCIFICRFFHNMKYGEIAKKYGLGISRVKMSVKRTKAKLKEYLEREGY